MNMWMWVAVLSSFGITLSAYLNDWGICRAPTMQESRIDALKKTLLKKKTLGQAPSAGVPHFKGLFPEYEDAFETFTTPLVVGGPPDIGKTTKTLDLLRKYDGPVFYFSFLGRRGDALAAVCEAAGVSNLREFEEAIRLASRKAPVILALDDVNTGYGENATIKDMAFLLGCLRSMSPDVRGLYISSEENVVHSIANDASSTPMPVLSLKPVDDDALRKFIHTDLKVDDTEAITKWVDHFGGSLTGLGALYHATGQQNCSAKITEEICTDPCLLQQDHQRSARYSSGKEKGNGRAARGSGEHGPCSLAEKNKLENGQGSNHRILRDDGLSLAPYQRQMQRAIEEFLKEEKATRWWGF